MADGAGSMYSFIFFALVNISHTIIKTTTAMDE